MTARIHQIGVIRELCTLPSPNQNAILIFIFNLLLFYKILVFFVIASFQILRYLPSNTTTCTLYLIKRNTQSMKHCWIIALFIVLIPFYTNAQNCYNMFYKNGEEALKS